MLYREILTRLADGRMKLDLCGHKVTESIFKDRNQRMIDYEAGAGDGKWDKRGPHDKSPKKSAKQIAERDAEIREHFKKQLDYDVKEGESNWMAMSHDIECRNCGRRLDFVLNGDVFALREYFDSKANDHVQTPVGFRCEFEIPKPITGEINVQSKLIFTNFFRSIEDYPNKELEHTVEWSLNNLLGRINITKHLCSLNIAYGQMSNMSVGIYVHKDKNSIIVGPSYHPADMRDDLTDEQYEIECKKPVFEGYKCKGTISLAVWRWMATDLKTLGPERYQELKDEEYMDRVECTVKKGIWQFEHYFTSIRNFDDPLYSRFTLKEGA